MKKTVFIGIAFIEDDKMNTLVLEKMGFRPTAHNEIYLDHLEVITDFLISQCPIPEKKALSMLRGSTGISLRYVKEHIDSLLAWGIIKKHQGVYEWVLDGCQETKIILEGVKNEDVPDTLPGNIGEYKPCIHRTDSMDCIFNPDKPFKPKWDKCNKCLGRVEV